MTPFRDKREAMRYVREVVNDEGLHYAMTAKSDYREIDDKRFHELRAKYIDAAARLEHYINEGATDDT